MQHHESPISQDCNTDRRTGPIISSDKYTEMQQLEGTVTIYEYDVPKNQQS